MPKKTKNTEIVEGVLSSISATRVDRENGIIYGVRLGGLKSKNKRRYKEAAYRKAIEEGKYDNCPCNVNHVEEGSQVMAESRFGMFHNARYVTSPEPGPVADLHYLKAHPMAERVCEAAERPTLARTFGMSHVAEASETTPGNDGWLIVEGFASIKSVDLVADPATVKGLYEHNEEKPMKQSIQAVMESAINEIDLPFQKKLWERYAKDERVAKLIKEEIETPEKAKPAELIKAGFNALATAAVSDESLTPDQAADAVKDVLTTKHTMLNGEAPVPVVPKKKEEEVPEEKESVVVGIKGANRICESLKFTPTSKQLEILSESTQELAQVVAEEFCRLSLAVPEKAPTSAGRTDGTQDHLEETIKPAANAKELAERIR